MKKAVLFTTLCICTLMSAALTGCSDDGGETGDQIAIPTYDFYIRFLSPSGTNILDSLNVCGDAVVRQFSDDELELRCVSSWKNRPVRKLYQSWWRIPEGEADRPFGDPLPQGTVAVFEWGDQLYFDADRPERLDVEYLITLRSRMIFGDDAQHTIKWYAKVLRNIYDAYKCEVDGEPYSLADDPVYNYWSPFWKTELAHPTLVESGSGYIHSIGAVITINVKK